MPLLSIVESAARVGYSVELLEYLTKNCPKYGETRTLPCREIDGHTFIDESDLLSYQRYLNERWPIPDGLKRPPLRAAIIKDVKEESHYGCAICGDCNHGEIAHIYPVADAAYNGPDNLLYLCPNHHTAYDYGHKVASNIRREVVDSAKTMKRESRRRMLRYEANAAKAMFGLIQQIKKIIERLGNEGSADLREVGVTEMKALLAQVSEASTAANADAKKDIDHSSVELELTKIAPKIAALAGAGANAKSEHELQMTASEVVAASNKVIIDLGEVECPHCAGSGQRGMAGSLCSFCGGSCYVATDVAKDYNADEIDEVDCPRCGGHCKTGWAGDFCAYCKGDGFVTQDESDDYDPDEMDEVTCPRCDGKGQVGWGGSLCSVCNGSCFIPREEAADYDLEKIDEVECPRCSGKGQTGWTGNLCLYCKGDGFVSEEQKQAFDPDNLDEINCPRCDGKGQIGWGNSVCPYCNGACTVSRAAHAEYNPDDLDEEECPRCNGSGKTGRVGDICKLCGGDCVVPHAKADAYREQYGLH